MPLPNVEFKVDQFNSGQYLVMKMVNGEPDNEEGKFWDLEEAKKVALELQIKYIAQTLFPYDKVSNDDAKTEVLVNITRMYFQDLLRILPRNADADYARKLVREAFSFARTAILLDGMV
jgi:hypothetical protein